MGLLASWLADWMRAVDWQQSPEVAYGRVYAVVDHVTKRTVAVQRLPLPSDVSARVLVFHSALGHALFHSLSLAHF